MPKVKLDVGATVDFLNKDELDDALSEYKKNAQAAEYEKLKGIKFFRLPVLYATPASGTVVLGESWSANGTAQLYTGQIMGPNEGYVWSIRHLACNGLGTGSSPDELNIYWNGHMGGQQPVWQLNGNNFAYTFGRGEMVLRGGEKLIAHSLGSMTSTNQVTLYGSAIEVPSELIGKLVQ